MILDGIKLFIRFITDIIKTLFKWEIMPNISLGLFILFFITLGFIIYLLFYVVIKRGD